MAPLPAPRSKAVDAIYAIYATKGAATERRPNTIAVSQAGTNCQRKLWLSFRWASKPQPKEGRIYRLFDTGSREEIRVIEDLREIGCVITGEQQRITPAPHVGGYIDGIIESGLPDAPKTQHLLEVKTHNVKSFAALQKHGVEKHKPEHWWQCQLGMHGTGTTRAAYVAVCKDDDSYYIERIEYNKEACEAMCIELTRLASCDDPPGRISDDPDYFECRFCDQREVCHRPATELPNAQRNCRTCAHFTAEPHLGTFSCSLVSPNEFKDAHATNGCAGHAYNPAFVGWDLAGMHNGRPFYERPDGSTWIDNPQKQEAAE